MELHNVGTVTTPWTRALWVAAGTLAVALIAAVALPVEAAGPVVLALPFLTLGLGESLVAG